MTGLQSLRCVPLLALCLGLSAPLDLLATVDDARYNDSNGVEPQQAIVEAERYVDAPPWAVSAAFFYIVDE